MKVYLLPDQSRTGKRKTKMKHATVDPEFNEELLVGIHTQPVFYDRSLRVILVAFQCSGIMCVCCMCGILVIIKLVFVPFLVQVNRDKPLN